MPYERVIRRRSGLIGVGFGELWQYRELLFFLAWRDILVRYKQTVIGVAWALIQPVMTMIVFTVVFGNIGKFPSGDAPYAVMTFAAILPWQFFANAMSQSSNSVVGAANMVQKVYFPRLIIPVSATLSGALDFLISLCLLFVLMLGYQVPFRLHLLWLPLFAVCALLAALSVGFWLSALNVRYRDVKYIVPFIVSMGLYLSPVGFMSTVVPEPWRQWSNLNPMVGVIDGFRWAVLGPQFEPDWTGFAIGMGVVCVLLVTGLLYFRSTEKTFADVI